LMLYISIARLWELGVPRSWPDDSNGGEDLHTS
jgi:hypothetical protein